MLRARTLITTVVTGVLVGWYGVVLKYSGGKWTNITIAAAPAVLLLL